MQTMFAEVRMNREKHDGICCKGCFKLGYQKAQHETLDWVLKRIEFIENNSDWNCVTLKKDIETKLKEIKT